MQQAWSVPTRSGIGSVRTHIPFTAPLLSGVCGRTDGNGLVFILPNPSGGRGSYVLDWAMAVQYAAPTLHDTLLARRLAACPAIDPLTVRDLARLVACEGYAGRLAAEAAVRAASRREADMLRLWSQLVLALIRTSNIDPSRHVLTLAGLGEAGPRVMTEGLHTLATDLGWVPEQLAAGLCLFATVGAPLQPGRRIAALLSSLTELETGLSREAVDAADGSARPILPARTLSCVQRCALRLHSLAAEAGRRLEQPDLLARWRADPAGTVAPLVVLERAMDGWDRICMLWRECATLSARLAALPELALLVGLADVRLAEAEAEGRAPAATAASSRLPGIPGTPAAMPDRHGGLTSSLLVERAEQVRRRELDLENGDG